MRDLKLFNGLVCKGKMKLILIKMVCAASGKIDNTLINNILDHYNYNFKTHSLDIKDFDINFVSLFTEDAFSNLNFFLQKLYQRILKINYKRHLIILCGGGRKINSFQI